ncbi:hypothetical protein LDENG_00043500 [Lucifuga dentata]|nr:hypothetical protein LDENG_00043500 [Lucifuga dentata]
MRSFEQQNMIGTLLFYGLYPLSQFFIRHISDRHLISVHLEATKKGLSPADVWDGVATPTKRSNESQTVLLDQRLSKEPGLSGETGKGMVEQNPGMEDNSVPDISKEQLMAALPEEAKNDGHFEKSEMQRAEPEPEMNDGKQQGTTLKQENQQITAHFEELQVKQDVEETVIFSTESIGPQEIWSYREQKPTEDSKPESACQLEEQIERPHLEESDSVAETTAKEFECWDEYIIPSTDTNAAGARSPMLVVASCLSDSGTLCKDSSLQHAQTGWHFPAGPGLADEVQCPLWQFPSMSYYPPLEQTTSFEVMWRVWEEVDDGATAVIFPYTKTSFDFTVMSYNILAQDLLEAHKELYTHCPLEVLEWSYRCSLLLWEIQKLVPDILCLQEVQENHYNEHLHPVLSQMGYTCVYKRRTENKTDGCAICYRSDRFSELSVTLLEFCRPETELLNRHNVGIVLLLRPVVTQGSEVKAKGLPLCVANTHLLFNPRRGDVKLAQLAIMLAEIDGVFKSCKVKGEHCNIILCGDFNSVPHKPLYQLITTGQLFYKGLPAWMVSGQEDLSQKTQHHRLFAPLWPSSLGISDNCQYSTDKQTFEKQSQDSGKHQYSRDLLMQLRFCPASCVRPLDLELIPGVTDNTPDASRTNQPNDQRLRHRISHRLDLQSVYKHILPGSGHSEVTTLHSEAGATVDYIFYSPKHVLPSDHAGLKLLGCLSLLSEDVLWSLNGLPSHIFPSDHLSLLAKFQLHVNAV